MDMYKNTLNAIPEEQHFNNEDMPYENNKLCIELTIYLESMPSIKSYYFMSHIEYEELKTLHMDLYIENFINKEDLTKEKLDIYLVNNSNNINIIQNFIGQFGNPFDIINHINTKQTIQKQLNKIKKQDTHIVDSLIDNFSESDSDSSNAIIDKIFPNSIMAKSCSNKECLTIKKKVLTNTDPIINSESNSETDSGLATESDSGSDSDSYIDTVSEIIDTYNKSKKIDNEKIQKISQHRPDLLNDVILDELIKK